MSLLSPILYRTSPLDPQTRLISRPWADWLAALSTRVGGYGEVASLTDLLALLAALTLRVTALEAVTQAHHGLPTVQPVALGAGAGAVASVTGRDMAGVLTLTTAAYQARRSHSAVAMVTFHAAYPRAPIVTLAPANDAAAALEPGTVRLRSADSTATTFTLRSGRTRLPRDADTFQWTYQTSEV